MINKKLGVILGLSAVFVLTGCQSTDVPAEAPVSTDQSVETESEVETEVDYSKGFKSSKEALHTFMTEIVEDDYALAYDTLYQIDKETFSVDDYTAYQKAMQLAKDVHGYSIHDEQTFWDFEFAGTTFEQVDFFDLDYAYVELGEDAIAVGTNDDHGHDEGSDYMSHDHGHEMATMGVATVKRNGTWYVLQGQTKYELHDLTRKYTNQSISMGMEHKEAYILGEAASVGNMIISLNDVKKDTEKNKYILDVTFLNAGFDPLDTAYFINKFAVIDDKMKNYMSLSSMSVEGMDGVVRSGSYVRGLLEVPVEDGFETDSVFFLMNTIDPNRKPIEFDITKSKESNMDEIYSKMMRKPSESLETKAYIDGMMISVSNVNFVESTKLQTAPEGWKVMTFDAEVSNLTDAIVYTNQIDMTMRSSEGYAKSIQDQIPAEKLEGVTSVNGFFETLVKDDGQPIELTLCIKDARPNNSVTVNINRQ